MSWRVVVIEFVAISLIMADEYGVEKLYQRALPLFGTAEGATAFAQVARLQPTHASAHANLALCLLRLNPPQYANAASHQEKVLRLVPVRSLHQPTRRT